MTNIACNGKKIAIGLFVVFLFILLALPGMVGADDTSNEDDVFISIRRYEGVDATRMNMTLADVARITSRDFLPILRESDGFIGYYWVYTDEDVLVAINIFETREGARASNELAREYVAENFAELVAGPPLIVDGSVDIGFVEILDGMGDDDVSSLHASVRIYDGFEADDLDEFVATVEDGFLPIMRDTDGFFAYYLMNNGAGAVAAISLFDSEASALASNEKARDFVAENLAAFLPKDPLTTSGRAGIAVLAAVNGGANLITDAIEASIFASVRVYDGVDSANQDEIVRQAAEGFLPIMRESEGFVGYYLLPAGEMLAAISLFDSAEQASASNDAARDFVAENLAPLLPNAPMIIEGELDVAYVAVLEGMMDAASVSTLYGALRLYDNYDLTHRDEIVKLVRSIFLPIQQEMAGFFGYFTMDDQVDMVSAFSIFDTEENALAANVEAAAFVAEYLAQWPRDEPIRINGRLGVAALADAHMGENLIGEVVEG